MRTSWIPISRSCDNKCRFCDVADRLDGRPIAATALRAAIDAAFADRAERIVFTGGEPTRSPDLLRAISHAHALGLRVALTTNGRSLSAPDRIGRLKAAGLDEVRISLHGASAATHVPLVGGDPVAFEQTLRAIRLCAAEFDTTVRMVLTMANAGDIERVVAIAATHRARFELLALRDEGSAADGALGLEEDANLAAWRTAWRACRAHGVPFSHQGFSTTASWDRTALVHGSPVDDETRELLRLRLHDAWIRGGLLLPTPDVLADLASERGIAASDLPALFAADRTPFLSAARHADSPVARALTPGTRVVVVVDDHADPIVAASTFPALVHALAARGVDAHLASMYRRAFDPTSLATGLTAVDANDGRPLGPDDPHATPAVLARASIGLARRLGELARDVPTLVVFWGFASAELWRGLPELRDAIVHIVDPGNMADLRTTPGPHDVVHAANPTTARTRSAAIGLTHVRWSPLPVWLPHVAPASASGRGVLVPHALVERAEQALLAAGVTEPPPLVRFDPGAAADTVAFQLSTARAMWIPALPADAVDARALSLARAAGLPIVGAIVPAIVDHVRPDDAILARPDDLTAQVHALHALSTQPARLALLRNAARVRRGVASVERLAEVILHGDQRPLAVPLIDGVGPWWSW